MIQDKQSGEEEEEREGDNRPSHISQVKGLDP